MGKFLKLLLIPLSLFSGNYLLAEEISVFDQNRSQNKEVNAALTTPKKPVKRRNKNKFDLQLIGIQRWDEKYTFIVQNSQGKQEKFQWTGEPVLLREGYFIEGVADRTIRIKLDQNISCVEDEKLKISCNPQEKMMHMAIVRQKSIAPPAASKRLKKYQRQRNKRQPIKKQTSVAEKNQEKQSTGIKRIKDEDVPDNMRRVRTPFGDQLVPKEEE